MIEVNVLEDPSYKVAVDEEFIEALKKPIGS